MPMENYKVESFSLDHTKVVAPFIRLAARKVRSGVAVTKFDVRFTQPNQKFLPPPVLHTIEHLLAERLRWQADNIIDFSPMGCGTGFYLTVFGDCDEVWAERVLRAAMEEALRYDHVPAQNEKQCGNFRSHDLQGAKEAIREFLAHDARFLTDPYGNGITT